MPQLHCISNSCLYVEFVSYLLTALFIGEFRFGQVQSDIRSDEELKLGCF